MIIIIIIQVHDLKKQLQVGNSGGVDTEEDGNNSSNNSNNNK